MEPQRLNSCLLKTVSQPFSGFPKTTEKCRLFQCGRFKGFIDFYLGFPATTTPSPRFCACLLFLFFFFIYFFDQVLKIPRSEGDGGRKREVCPHPVPCRRRRAADDPDPGSQEFSQRQGDSLDAGPSPGPGWPSRAAGRGVLPLCSSLFPRVKQEGCHQHPPSEGAQRRPSVSQA